MSIKDSLNTQFVGLNWSKSFGDDVIVVAPSEIYPIAEFLKANGHFDFVMNITGTDYPGKEKRFEVSYEFFHSKTHKRLRMKTSVAEGETIKTLVPLWRGANWFEREIYDMIGVKFEGHPNMLSLIHISEPTRPY